MAQKSTSHYAPQPYTNQSVFHSVSVTLRYCMKMTKRGITQIMPHDRPGTGL